MRKGHKKPCICVLECIAIMLLFTASQAFGATDPSRLRCRAHDVPTETVWVGQQVGFYVTLSMAVQPKGSPRFTQPDVSGGILLSVSGSPVYGSETQDGITYTTWTYSFAFYPHRSGKHTVPPISARVTLPDNTGGFHEYTADTIGFTVESRLPEGAEGLPGLVSTTDLEAKETWDPENTDVRVGDAITRTITLRAPNVMGMGFAPLSFDPVDGVALYPKEARVNDEINRGDITGERVETVVYICEKKGRVTLPELVISWFDTDSQKVRRETFPERKFKVSANPALAGHNNHVRGLGASGSTGLLVKTAIILAVLTACLLTWYRFRRPMKEYLKHRKARVEDGEPFHYKRLVSAIRRKDTKDVINRSHPWLQRACRGEDIRTLSDFADRYGSEAFRSSVRNFMDVCFGRGTQERSNPLDDPSLIRGLDEARKRCLKKEKPGASPLKPLNPIFFR